MKTIAKYTPLLVCIIFSSAVLAQENDKNGGRKKRDNENTNVFTSGLFMQAGNFELKNFNNLYTQIEPISDNFEKRSSFFTSFIQLTIGSNSNINYGIDMLYRSNVVSDFGMSSPFKVLRFKNEDMANNYEGGEFTTSYNHGLSHIGGRVRTKPFADKRFTVQQALYAPTGRMDGSWIINTDLFFENVFADKFLLFVDLGVWYSTGQLPFPYLKFFTGTFIANRFAPFAMINLPYELGPGLKIFITPKVELEFLYTYWLPLEFIVGDRRPETFNFGLRVTNFKNF